MDGKESLQIMKVSLRVLARVNDRAAPDPADVDDLRYYLGSEAPPDDLDELACAVIKKALQQRSRIRAARKAVERVSHLEQVLKFSANAPGGSKPKPPGR